MIIRSDLLPPDQPNFFRLPELSDEEEIPSHAFRQNLHDMADCATDFVHAVALYDFASAESVKFNRERFLRLDATDFSAFRETPVWDGWVKMAFEYGALSLRNFGQAFHAAQGLIGRIPSWMKAIDRQRIKAARLRFDAAFPNVDKIRHSVAHPEYYSNPDKKMSAIVENVPAAIESAAPLTVKRGMVNRTYFATFDGVAVRYDLTLETAETLRDITRDCYSAIGR